MAEAVVAPTGALVAAIVDAAPDVIVFIDAAGSIRWANATTTRVLGYDPSKLVGRSVFEFLHPDECNDAMNSLQNTMARDELHAVPLEVRVRSASGSWKCLEVVATNLLADPAVNGIVLRCADVSYRHDAAEQLAQREARSRTLLEASPHVITIVYPDGSWEANDEGTRSLGYPKGFDPPGGVFELVHPEDRAAAEAAFVDVVGGSREPSEWIEIRLRASDGTYRPFECVAKNLIETDIGGVVITARDITARKRAEAEMRAAEQRFRVAFDKAPLIMSIVDLDGRIIDINPAGCRTLRRDHAELVGTLAEETVHPDDRAATIDGTSAQLFDATTRPIEFRVVDALGNATPVLSHASLVEPEHEAPYVITLQADISDRKRLEAELEARATHDDLSGLFNRTSFDHLLEHELLRRDAIVAAIFIDLDDFKSINDRYGHAAGDQAIIQVSERITSHLRGGDIAARIGGDEFVIACSVTDPNDARTIAERVRVAIEAGFQYDDHHIALSGSVGVALSHSDDNAATLLRRADTATYIAKHDGKGRTKLLVPT